MGKDTRLKTETKTSARKKKSLNLLEMPCVRSPQADSSVWAGISPAVAQNPSAITNTLKKDVILGKASGTSG